MKDFYTKEYFDWMKKTANYRPKIYRLISNLLWYFKPRKVLDVGCGHGFLVKELLNLNIEATGIDFSEYAGTEIPNNFIKADAKHLPFNDKIFDVVISSDFFEHLEEKDIDKVYSEMKRVGENVIALISFKKSESHLTVKPREWWENKLPGCIIIKTFLETKCQQS